MTPASSLAPCLILEPMPLVAHDLATTLHDTLCRPTLVAASESQATMLLAELGPEEALHMAIVRMSPGLFAQSPLRPLLEARNAHVILMGSEPEAMENTESWPWAMLEWPFGTGQLLALLGGLGLLPDAG